MEETGVALLDVAGKHDAIHGGLDGGIGELLLELAQRGLGLGHLGLGLMQPGGCRR